jgi:hypothetical protein
MKIYRIALNELRKLLNEGKLDKIKDDLENLGQLSKKGLKWTFIDDDSEKTFYFDSDQELYKFGKEVGANGVFMNGDEDGQIFLLANIADHKGGKRP